MKQIDFKYDFKLRDYQKDLFLNSINKNTLIVLPTGLGKTIVAFALIKYYYEKQNKKILFLAPTKPLVEQQKKSFENFLKHNEKQKIILITGQTHPKKRIELYKANDFIFSTPQVIENDLLNGTLNKENFEFIIIDEAHRSTGNYSYCFLAEQFSKSSKILAMSASPATTKEDMEKILENLFIENIEIKKYTDNEVKKYVKEKNIKKIEVELTKEIGEVKKDFEILFDKNIKKIQESNFLVGVNYKNITKTNLLDLQKILRVKIVEDSTNKFYYELISDASGLMKLQYGIELIESQGITSAFEYFKSFGKIDGDTSKAARNILLSNEFKKGFKNLILLKEKNVLHPKLIKLKKIVEENFSKNKDLKIIIFSQYKQSVKKIVEEISKIKNVKPKNFIGQSKRHNISLSQKEQKIIIEEFKEGKINTIVSTSIGEEGLDIPKVDLVIFYEPIPSAIRTIQRIGRTGRFQKGEVLILITKDTRDVITSYIATNKERKMYKVLEEIKFSFKEKSLNKFVKTEIKNDERKLIFIDSRENKELVKKFFNSEIVNVKTQNLEVGDIIINEYIGIERKTKKDFIDSIIDKRLFSQLIDLVKNYKRPILLLEGEENLLSVRNLHENIIYSVISTIAIELRIPIIYSKDINETKKIVEQIVVKLNKKKKNISLTDIKKSSISTNESLEKFISSIPSIDISVSKKILEKFKTIKKIVNSKKEKFLEVELIGEKRAKFLEEFFNKKYEKD